MQTIRILALMLALVGVSRAALPTIDTQPASSTNCVGTTATFTVAASSDSSTNFQWYFNATNAIVDATNSAHVIASVSALDAGTYSVVVTNNDGAVTSVLAVLVVNTPTTASSFLGATSCVGASATFTTTAGGTGPFAYVWRKDGGAALGSTSNSLVLSGVTAGDAGVYSVEVTGACNSATNSATLTVNPAPTVTVNGATTVCPGTSVILDAITDATNPAYLWTPGGATTASITNAPGVTTVYTVLVTDGVTGCTNSGSATITVNVATTASAIGNKTNCPATAVSFTTTASGTGPFTYTWRKNGTLVQGPDANNTFNIASVVPADAATYSVEVAGLCNTVTNSGLLVVVVAPAITSQPPNRSTPMGNGAAFSVTAVTNSPVVSPLTYQWRTNGVDVTGATGSSFTISNVPLAFNGMQVAVTVANCGGSVLSSAATLTVTPVSSISFDFNTPGQFTNAPFNMFGNDWMNNRLDQVFHFGPVTLWESTTGGVGVATSGALDLAHATGFDQSTTLLPFNWDFSQTGKVVNASLLVRIKIPVNATRRAIQMGIITGTNYNANTVGALSATLGNNVAWGSGIFQSVIANVNNPTYQLRTQTKAGNTATAIELLPVNTPTNTAGFATNRWIRLDMQFVNVKGPAGTTIASNYTTAITITDMGLNGVTPGAILQALPPTLNTNIDLVNSEKVYFCIREFEDGGIDMVDNLIINDGVSGPVTFVQQPVAQSVAQGGFTTFSTRVTGDGPFTFQWYRNGSPIPGAGNWKYRTPQQTLANSGDLYHVVVTNASGTVSSTPVALTVTPDTLDVLSVGSVDGGTIGLRFDQPVNAATAEIPGNYLINGVAASSAKLRVFDPLNPMQQLRTNQTEVLLTPAATVAGSFTVVVSGVTSISGTPLGNNSAVGSVLGLTAIDIDPLSIRFMRPEISSQVAATYPGSTYSFASNQLDVISGGHDIFGNFDGMRFNYKVITGDFDLKVRIPYLDPFRNSTKAGFDARVSLDPAAPHVGAFANAMFPALNRFEGTFRTNYNQATASWGNATATTYPNTWLRFRRAGNTFMRYSSVNGVNWLLDGQLSPSSPGSQGIQFPDTLYVGIAGNCNVGGNTVQGPATAQYDSFGDFAGYANALLTIVGQPLNQTNLAGNSTNLTGLQVTFTTNGVTVPVTAGEMAFIWQRSNGAGGWTNLATAGLTQSNLVTGALFANDNGAQYRAIVQAPGALSVTSAVATVTVTDLTAPTVVQALMVSNSPNQMVVYFSEKVGATALNAANYTLTNQLTGLTYTFASARFLNADGRTVILTLNNASLPPSPRYALGVSGVQDLGGQTIANVTLANLPVSGMGLVNSVVIDYYGSLATAANLGDLTGNIKFINNSPDWVMYSNSMNLNNNGTFPTSTPMLGDNYGVKMYSYFVAPSNSQYVFWWKADDFAQFSMTTNPAAAGGTTNALFKTSGAILTANNPNYAIVNTFVTPPLTAGQAYYTELLVKEGGGGDGGSVFVTMTSSTSAVPAAASISPTYLWAFPDAVARPPKMMVDFFTGLGNVGQTAISGNGNLPDLLWTTNFQNVIASTPNGIGYETISGYGTNLGNTSLDNYLGILRGYFLPPTNGNYRFYTRSDDSSSFFMNTNAANSTDPAGKVHLRSQFAFTNITQYWQAPQVVTLTGGQLYYMEGMWREGGGGDGMTIAVRGGNEPAPTTGQDLIPASMLVFPTNLNRVGPINFNLAGSAGGITPLNPTVREGESITFQARGLSGAAPYLGFIYTKNGVQVGANATVSYPANVPYFWVSQPMTLADNGAVITLTVTNYFSSVSATSVVTVLPDTTAPTITSAVASQYGDSVVVTFNEIVDSYTAQQTANYSIAGLQVYSASRDDIDRNSVILRTSPHTPGTVYNVIVNGVRDTSAAGNPTVAAMKSFTAWGFGGLGTVYVEGFTNMANTTVDMFLLDPRGIYNMPDFAYYTNVFAGGQFAAHSGLEFWTIRISGLFMPPSNGLYRFYIRSDDGGRLYMNTNGPSPSGKVQIARSDTANPAQNGPDSQYISQIGLGYVGAGVSPILSLTNGTPYYMESIVKEGGGGDYMQVVMRAVDANGQPLLPLPAVAVAADVMGAGFFQATGNPDINQLLIVSAPPTDLTVFENELVNLELVANAIPASLTPYITYQWQRTNDGSGTFTNIPGATGPLLSFYSKLTDDGANYRIRASIPGQTAFFPTLLHVQTDGVAPYLVTTSAREPINGKQLVGIAFDGPVDAGIATEPSSYYAVDDYATAVSFSAAQYRPGFPNKLLLTVDETTGVLIGNYTLFCDYMKDTAAVPNEGFGLSATGAVQRLTEQVVGALGSIAIGGYNPAAPGLGFVGLATPTEMYTDTNGGWDVSANGWDIWNTADGFQFGYREVTGNFDIKTRIQKFTGADQWSKAGLMVRPSTNSNSRMFFMCATPRTTPIAGQAANNLFAGQYRDLDGGAPANVQNAIPPSYPNAWVRLQRSNSVFYGYWSTNGTDWTNLLFRDFSQTVAGSFPDTVLVGLGTASHDQTRSLANNAYAEYRDLYFPNPAVITSQPTPDFVEIGIHQSVSFTGLAATGDGVRFQWRRNGVALDGETNATLTLPNTAVGQSGIYTAAAFTDGGGQISSNVVLVVTNVLPVANSDSLVTTQGVTLTFTNTALTANDTDFELDPVSVLAVFYPHTVATNFDGIVNTNIIAGATMYGSAHVTNGIGTGGTPALTLNDGLGNLSGSIVFNESTPGARVLAFQASFNLRIADGSAEPADGFSFNFAADIPNSAISAQAAENGAGTGFSFCVDNYRFAPYPAGGTASTSGMKLRYNNVDIAGVQIPTWNNVAFVPVEIRLDMAGNLTVLVNGTNVFGNRVLPWTPTAGRFGIFARTGGSFEAHAIDDLSISYIAEDTQKGGLVTLTNGVVAYTPPAIPCGPDLFYYLASDGQVGGTNVGTVNVNVIGTNPPVLVSCVPNQNIAVGVGCATGILPDLRGQLVVVDCGPLSIGQDPAPGSALAFGANVVTFNITNNAGFITNCTATISVVDITPPVAVCPGNITAEATSASGAVVSFATSATDNCTVASLIAVPASGSTFPIGVTVVTVTATDTAGLTNACTFTVTVQDTTAPALGCPPNQIVACTSTNGAVVTYSVTSLDLVDPLPTLIVTPPSGTTFSQGTNVVTALTYDSFGNTNTCSFLVIVEDQTPALLTITQVGTNVVVCYPQTCTPYVLEGTADLNSPITWVPVGLPVDVVGSDFCVTIPANDPKKFFRLHKP